MIQLAKLLLIAAILLFNSIASAVIISIGGSEFKFNPEEIENSSILQNSREDQFVYLFVKKHVSFQQKVWLLQKN